MHSRGRDKAVSRGRPKERRRHTISISRSPSPLSSAESRSPRSPGRSPTPPLTLEDRVHIAYAADDVHLAKILLLRLQGIEVTSDSDPRIAAVRDEDFDACFVPFGPLDDGRGPHSHQISVQAAPDPEARRAEALRAKERLWESEARRFTEERCKHAALKRGQDSASVEQDRIRLAKQKEAAAAQVDLRRRRIKPTARTLNFALVPPAPKPPSGQKFTYDFPFTPRNINIPPRSRRSPERKSPQPHAHEEAPPTKQMTRVPFADVLACLHGAALFPVLPCERDLPLRVSTNGSKARRERALLDALLVAGLDLDFELDLKRKGKGKAQVCKCTASSSSTQSSSASSTSSSASASSATSSSSGSSGLSRAGSWLSFGSRSSRSSTGTSIASSWTSASTILSSSPSAVDSPIKSLSNADSPVKSRLSGMGMTTWLPSARRTTSPEGTPSLSSVQTDTDVPPCRCQARLVRDAPRVPAPTHPLLVSLAASRATRRTAARLDAYDDAQDHAKHLPFTLTLTRLAALARNLQAAYVRAVVVGYGVGAPEGGWDDSEREDVDGGRYDEGEDGEGEYWAEEKRHTRAKATEPIFRPPPAPLASKLRVRPMGRRVSGADVRRFLAVPTSAPGSPTSSTASPSGANASASSSLTSLAAPPTESPADDLDQFAPLALLAPLPSSYSYSSSSSSSSSSRKYTSSSYTHPPARTPLPAYPPPRVFTPPPPLPRSPWAPAGRPVAVVNVNVVEGGEGASAPHAHARDDSEADADGYTYAAPRQPVLRARAVPNSAFLRVKALQAAAACFANAAAETTSGVGVGVGVGGAGGGCGVVPTPTPRRPRECVVGLGVDNAPGSGLRFVYASARAVVV